MNIDELEYNIERIKNTKKNNDEMYYEFCKLLQIQQDKLKESKDVLNSRQCYNSIISSIGTLRQQAQSLEYSYTIKSNGRVVVYNKQEDNFTITDMDFGKIYYKGVDKDFIINFFTA